MRINRVLGFGLFLVMLGALMPQAFGELSKTTVVFLESSQEAFAAAGALASEAALTLPPR